MIYMFASNSKRSCYSS